LKGGVSSRLPPGDIEGEIRQTRDRIGARCDALAARLAPHRLLQRGLEMASRFPVISRRGRPDGEAGFRAEPLALVVIAAGLAWLVADNLRARRRPGAADGAGAAGGPATGENQPDDPAAKNPLFLGLLGLGAGAALAALLPSCVRERQLIAQAREELWQSAEALGHETAARLKSLGGDSASGTAEHPSVE
jgi:Protein of unknown function (DUF3618)